MEALKNKDSLLTGPYSFFATGQPGYTLLHWKRTAAASFAVKLVDASAFYPLSAVIGGWAARSDYYDANRETHSKIIRGWAETNDDTMRSPGAAMEALQKKHYSNAAMADISEAFKAQKTFSSREWKRLYADGTVVKWLQQGTDFFIGKADSTKAIPGSEYFDPSLYLAVMS